MNLLPSKPRFLSSFGIKNPLCIPAPIPKSESDIELSSGCSKTLWSHNETPKSQKKMKKKGSEAWGAEREDQRVVESQAPHKSWEMPGDYMSTAEIYGSGRKEHAWGPAWAKNTGQKIHLNIKKIHIKCPKIMLDQGLCWNLSGKSCSCAWGLRQREKQP